MKISIIKSAHTKTTNWSGGTTTELFIYPAHAQYQHRDFDFRLSTATVEVESSVFTPLHGVSRTLMVLDGSMTLSHKDHHTISLNKFEQDQFEGGWETSSQGQCIDFNLMTMGTASGNVKGLSVNQNQETNIEIEKEANSLFVYVYAGQIELKNESKNYLAGKGDMLHIENLNIDSVQLVSNKTSDLVICQIKH